MALDQIARKLGGLLHLVYEPPVSTDDWNLDSSDIDQQLVSDKRSSLFLGHYSIQQVEQGMRAVGIYSALARKGYSDLVLTTSADDRYTYRLHLYAATEDPANLIGEVVLREGIFTPKDHFVAEPRLDRTRLLFIEWLLMQDVAGQFTLGRPQLPGQDHPGLGVGQAVVGLLGHMARALAVEGIINSPEYYHNAYFYKRKANFRFYNPNRRGVMRALSRDLGLMHLADRSWAIHLGCVRNKETGEVFAWTPEEQIMAIGPALWDYFGSSAYEETWRSVFETTAFEVDRKLLTARMAKAKEERWNTKES